MLRRTGWLLVLALVGCGCSGQSGPRRIAVEGAVDHKAQPLVNGTITIVPDGKQPGPAANGMIEKGEFHIPASEGPSEGPHTVIINLTPRKIGSHNTTGLSPQMPAPRMHWEFKVDISKEQKSLDLVLEDK